MKNAILKFRTALLASALGLVSLSAFPNANAAPMPPDHPMLWRVEGNGLEKPSYLFGTIHISNDRIAFLHPAAERAFVQADVVHTEISMEVADQMGGAMLMMRKDGKTLSEAIGPELVVQLSKALDGIQPGLDIAILQPMKTWAAAMLIVMLPHQLEGRAALDTILWNRAKEEGKSTVALETVESQIAAFETLNEAEQVLYLGAMLDALEEGQQLVNDMIAAYEKGDDVMLHQILTKSMEIQGDDEALRKLNERLLDALLVKRDVTLAASMAKALSEKPGQSHFFAVGAAHYLGDASIRKHLAEKGYIITRITE